MSRVRGRDTTPEIFVRQIVHRMGYRFRLHRSDLPSKPDLVFPGREKIILVHGCFWHRHRGCSKATMPKSNTKHVARKVSTQSRTRSRRSSRTEAGWLEGAHSLAVRNAQAGAAKEKATAVSRLANLSPASAPALHSTHLVLLRGALARRLRRRDAVRRLRAVTQDGTRAALELPPGPLGVPARSWLTDRLARSSATDRTKAGPDAGNGVLVALSLALLERTWCAGRRPPHRSMRMP